MTVNCPHNEQKYLFGRGGNDPEHQEHQADIGRLLDNHHSIHREVSLSDNGFTATTTSSNKDIAQTLQKHVLDMKARFAKGRAIRSWDKLYALLFAYRDHIHIDYTIIPNGVTSHVTTKTPQLIALLHAHAHAVSGFAEQGRGISGQPYPLSADLENLPLDPHNLVNHH